MEENEQRTLSLDASTITCAAFRDNPPKRGHIGDGSDHSISELANVRCKGVVQGIASFFPPRSSHSRTCNPEASRALNAVLMHRSVGSLCEMPVVVSSTLANRQ